MVNTEEQRTALIKLKKEWELELDKPFDPNFPIYRNIVLGTIQGIEESARTLGINLEESE